MLRCFPSSEAVSLQKIMSYLYKGRYCADIIDDTVNVSGRLKKVMATCFWDLSHCSLISSVNKQTGC